MSLHQQIRNATKGANSIDYLAKTYELSNTLVVAGEDLQDKELVLIVLNGLGKEYESFVQNIMS